MLTKADNLKKDLLSLHSSLFTLHSDRNEYFAKQLKNISLLDIYASAPPGRAYFLRKLS